MERAGAGCGRRECGEVWRTSRYCIRRHNSMVAAVLRVISPRRTLRSCGDRTACLAVIEHINVSFIHSTQAVLDVRPSVNGNCV